jgi:hypothetical protein
VLLNDIIALATDTDQPVSALLRKCLVLAHELDNELLKDWVNNELDSYPAENELPDYRILHTVGAVGLFEGQAFVQVQRPIPSRVLKPEHRHWAEQVKITESIKSLEHLLDLPSDTVTYKWDANLVLAYQNELFGQWRLLSAWQSVPKSAIAGILDKVRTRALRMALELRDELGEVQDLNKVSAQRAVTIERVVMSNISGNVYLSTGYSSMSVQQQNISVGDWTQLEKVLENSGLTKPEIHELFDALSQDGKKIGAKTEGWIKKYAPSVVSGGVKIAVAVGQALLTDFLKKHLGLP